jgi:hypothetical protein
VRWFREYRRDQSTSHGKNCRELRAAPAGGAGSTFRSNYLGSSGDRSASTTGSAGRGSHSRYRCRIAHGGKPDLTLRFLGWAVLAVYDTRLTPDPVVLASPNKISFDLTFLAFDHTQVVISTGFSPIAFDVGGLETATVSMTSSQMGQFDPKSGFLEIEFTLHVDNSSFWVPNADATFTMTTSGPGPAPKFIGQNLIKSVALISMVGTTTASNGDLCTLGLTGELGTPSEVAKL